MLQIDGKFRTHNHKEMFRLFFTSQKGPRKMGGRDGKGIDSMGIGRVCVKEKERERVRERERERERMENRGDE